MEQKKTEYARDLKNPLWQKKKNMILERDNYTCQHCGATDRTLHVHHKLYRKGVKPWQYDDAELLTLCEDCHDSVSSTNADMYDDFKEVKQAFREAGFSDHVFDAILNRIAAYFENIKEDGFSDDNFILELVRAGVTGTQNFDDLCTLAKFGIREYEFVNNCYPDLYDKYMNIKSIV